MTETFRGADLIARTLSVAGIERLFTLSGNQIMPIFDACIDEAKCQLLAQTPMSLRFCIKENLGSSFTEDPSHTAAKCLDGIVGGVWDQRMQRYRTLIHDEARTRIFEANQSLHLG